MARCQRVRRAARGRLRGFEAMCGFGGWRTACGQRICTGNWYWLFFLCFLFPSVSFSFSFRLFLFFLCSGGAVERGVGDWVTPG